MTIPRLKPGDSARASNEIRLDAPTLIELPYNEDQCWLRALGFGKTHNFNLSSSDAL